MVPDYELEKKVIGVIGELLDRYIPGISVRVGVESTVDYVNNPLFRILYSNGIVCQVPEDDGRIQKNANYYSEFFSFHVSSVQLSG